MLKYLAKKIAHEVKAEIKASITHDQQFPHQATLIGPAKERGIDKQDSKATTRLENIEKSRQKDPIIFRGIDYFDKLTIGTGITLQSENEVVLKWAKKIWSLNKMNTLQHRMAIELASTANLFAYMPKAITEKDTQNDLAIVPAIQIIPSGQITKIATKDGNVIYYHREWKEAKYPEPKFEIQTGSGTMTETTVDKWQDIPEDEMIHIAINCGAQALRGISMIEPAHDWAGIYGRSVEKAHNLVATKSAFAWHVKLKGPTDDTAIENFKNSIEDSLVTVTDARGQEYDTLATGQIIVTGDDIDVNPISSDARAGSSDEEIRRQLLMAAVAMGLPEFALSDGNYANLASSYTQNNPFFRLMQSFQITIIGIIRDIFRMAFDRLMEAGYIKNVDLDSDKEHIVDLLDISAPDILLPDFVVMAPAVTQLNQAKIISKREAAARLGLSWDKMVEEMNAEAEAGYGATTPAPQPSIFDFAQIDKDRHDETARTAQRINNQAKAALDKFKTAVLRNGTLDEMVDARSEYLKTVRPLMEQLIETTKRAGAGVANVGIR